MNVFPVLIAVFAYSVCICHGEDAVDEPAHLWLAEALAPGMSWAELKQKLPDLKDAEPYLSNAPNLTSARDSFVVADMAITVTFQFNDDRLYRWGAHLHDIDQEAAIGLADHLLPRFESRYGPSTREITLPFEHDGRRDEVNTAYIWNVNGWDAYTSLSFRPGSAAFGFGVSRPLMVTGHYFIGEPDSPLSGIGGGRNQHGPEPMDIIGQAGSMDSLHVLKMLHERGVTGSLPTKARNPADFGQLFDLHGGRFVRENDGKACLRLSWFRVNFPVTIWYESEKGARHAEVHFGMSSLFPEGIEFEGKALDLGRFEGWQLPHNQRPAKP